MFESEDPICNLPQEQSQENGFKYSNGTQQPKTQFCSSPFNGSLTAPEISVNDISLINQTQDLQITSPDNRESFQSVCSESDLSIYKSALYSQTGSVSVLETSNSIDEPFFNDSNLVTSKAEVHAFTTSPSPTFGTNDSTLMEDNATITPAGEMQATIKYEMHTSPDVYDEQATPSPILSPSPQGLEFRVTSIEGEKAAAEEEAGVASAGLQQQLDPEFGSESDSDSPSCETKADSFEFNTCSPFTQHSTINDSRQQQQQQPQEDIAAEVVPKEVRQEEAAVEVIASEFEQSQEPEKVQEQLRNMFPPLESATSCKPEGLDLEFGEDIEEPKLSTDFGDVPVISAVDTTSTEPVTTPDHPSNPFAEPHSVGQVMSPTLMDQEENAVITADNSSDISPKSNMNFNQVILESMAISSPVLSEPDVCEEINSNDAPSGYSSSFNEVTVIEHSLHSSENKKDNHVEETNNLPPNKFQEESEDSDSSQDSVKENTSAPEKQTLQEAEPEVRAPEIGSSPLDGMSNLTILNEPVTRTDEFAKDSSSPFPSEDPLICGLSEPVEMHSGQLGEEACNLQQSDQLSLVMIQSEKEDNQNEVFASHELRGTESENEVRNCGDGMNVNGSHSLFDDNHVLDQTKEGNILLEETLQKQPQNDQITSVEYRGDVEAQSIMDSSTKTEGKEDDSKASISSANISKIEMPSPMRLGLIDLNETNSPDLSQWGAPSLLLGQNNQDLMSSSNMSQASSMAEPSNRATPVAVEEMKPELMIDIMNEYKAFTPEKTSTPTLASESNQQPLSPQQPSQISDSVPDLIVQSKSVDLKKAVAGRAKVSRGEPKAPAPDVQRNTSKPLDVQRNNSKAPTAANSRATQKLTKTSAPTTSSRPLTTRTTASRPAVVDTKPSTAARKPVAAATKPIVARTAASATTRPATRPTCYFQSRPGIGCENFCKFEAKLSPSTDNEWSAENGACD